MEPFRVLAAVGGLACPGFLLPCVVTGTVLVKGGDMGEVLDCGRNPTGYLLALLLYCVGAHFWVALMVPDAQLLRF